jgi:hypothetical protein
VVDCRGVYACMSKFKSPWHVHMLLGWCVACSFRQHNGRECCKKHLRHLQCNPKYWRSQHFCSLPMQASNALGSVELHL